MNKFNHEIRDPIHTFIKLNSHERNILDCPSFQRLRYVHQLALTYLLYPAATHMRFEHSLGAMELAGTVFDVLTDPNNVSDAVRALVPEVSRHSEMSYWRTTVRMAALCHDIGHLPFSHAAEHLLPRGWNHELLTYEILTSTDLQNVFTKMIPPTSGEAVAKLAVGRAKLQKEVSGKKIEFSNWDAILSELIVSDVFGVDRMDYLLRDSLHTGVAYGKFDHNRLINTLRILVPPKASTEKDTPTEPRIGVEIGGLQAAESLLIARYMMFSQMYYHPVRLAYDIHLRDFLTEHLAGSNFPTNVAEHSKLNDFKLISEMIEAANDSKLPGHNHAEKIIKRKHFKVLYERLPEDVRTNPEAGKRIYEAAKAEFGDENVRHSLQKAKGENIDFPVQMRDKSVVSAMTISTALEKIPQLTYEYVFIEPSLQSKGQTWLRDKKSNIIKPEVEAA